MLINKNQVILVIFEIIISKQKRCKLKSPPTLVGLDSIERSSNFPAMRISISLLEERSTVKDLKLQNDTVNTHNRKSQPASVNSLSASDCKLPENNEQEA